ncbi:MAG: hypothetical protein ACTSWZ_01600 [Candidatus Heimdallarchaeaceae archaeon]
MRLRDKVIELRILFDAFEKEYYDERYVKKARIDYVLYHLNNDIDVEDVYEGYFERGL